MSDFGCSSGGGVDDASVGKLVLYAFNGFAGFGGFGLDGIVFVHVGDEILRAMGFVEYE